MPTDSRAVASVDDPALLRLATAGPDWRCAYCDAEQRAFDTICLQCGAARFGGHNTGAPLPQHAPPAVSPEWSTGPGTRAVAATRRPLPAVVRYGVWLLAGWAILRMVCSFVPEKHVPAPAKYQAPTPPRTDFQAKVVQSRWSRRIRIERWQLASHAAFRDEVPDGALAVRAAGSRVHHTDKVEDGETTIYVDEEVPDGYRTETYEERERCGETCTTTPRRCRDVCTTSSKRCREVCTNSRNGFASCHDVCTGGDRSCHEECKGGDRDCDPKYCTRTKTRQIPKTRRVKSPRRVPHYRDVPRYAPWASYQSWEWVEVQTESAAGDDATPRWPVPKTPIPAARLLAEGATPKLGSMREVRSESLEVTVETEDGERHTYQPASEDELKRLASAGATFKVRVNRGVLQRLD